MGNGSAFRRCAAALIAGLVVGTSTAHSQRAPENAGTGTWSALKNKYPGSLPDLALLLTDGTVMVHEGCSPGWYRLTPDKNGKYSNGAWSARASMPAGYGPLYFASQVLPDGRVIVNGGEYNFCSFALTDKGVVRADGIYQLANCCTPDSALATINGATVAWTILTQAQTGKNDVNDGEGWTTLPDQTVLTVDTGNCVNDPTSCTEVFETGSNTWSAGQRTCGQQVLAGSPPHMGPAALLPNGFVFAVGATTTNCIMDSATVVRRAGFRRRSGCRRSARRRAAERQCPHSGKRLYPPAVAFLRGQGEGCEYGGGNTGQRAVERCEYFFL